MEATTRMRTTREKQMKATFDMCVIQGRVVKDVANVPRRYLKRALSVSTSSCGVRSAQLLFFCTSAFFACKS
jgi:hypothetical protein